MSNLPPFAPRLSPETPLRRAITQATRIAEPEAIRPLLAAATLPETGRAAIAATARTLIEALRAKARHKGNLGGVQALVQEFALSSHEGVALMCLAEALLRIPDDATRDALIRDKLATGNWAAHLGHAKPLFVNAATWGLVITGKLSASVDETGLGHALTRMVHRLGEPVIRRGVDVAMRMMGEQFVMGETIAEALARARQREARGYGFSYDMLGEAAATAEDAAHYFASYSAAIHAIGQASAGRGVIGGPGISIKLSALHPRYSRGQGQRVMAELAPRVLALAELAKGYDIGFNIDAEETDRLELSLDLLEMLAHAPSLAGWQGLGFVIQAYQKRCPMVIDWIVDLARRTGRRLMIRLVKGAYWDAEIKRAQEAGLSDFPVYTRKVHTDLAYVACAQKLLAARDAVFPQFATHNAQTLATIHHLAGPHFTPGDYEFQCLHGMGEPLYDEVVGADGPARPCRVYAPVGTHETLLAYLVRRLLENGANSSFVNRIADPEVPVEALIEDPAQAVASEPAPGAPHPAITHPEALFADRQNARGLDLADEPTLAALAKALIASAAQDHRAGDPARPAHAVLNPADHRDVVGHVHPASAEDTARAAAQAAASSWPATPVETRAAALERAAEAMELARVPLIALLIREAGKSAANALAEVREAVDFLRYYAVQARTLGESAQPLGPVVCISPWNFPLAIFTGQIAAALAAGNPVLAKPAPETPLIAAEAVRILHAAGVPTDALHFLPGGGEVGAALVAAPEVRGVVFTGSTATARAIQQSLAGRLNGHGQPIPLIAETGGLNAMVVDSSALAEQVVADVLASAFDSAGQRCSALRLLCLQEDIADRTLAMLKAAMAELAVGNPGRLATDVGPVISERARSGIAAHVAAMRAAGFPITAMPLGEETAHGTFIAPTLIELHRPADLKAEIFGPVLHVVRYRANELDTLIEAINASGYGLTFGLHTRIDQTVERVTRRIHAGNLYVNRNMIGAVVGVQPFGGRGLSGTGPKAGGPLYLTRFSHNAVSSLPAGTWPAAPDPALDAFAQWATTQGLAATASAARDTAKASRLGFTTELPGPVGERNQYRLVPRGRVACSATSVEALWQQVAAVLATGNTAVITAPSPPDLGPVATRPAGFPAALAARVEWVDADLACIPDLAAMLAEGPGERIAELSRQLAAREGAIVSLHTPDYSLDLLLEEITLSNNTTAAGGNASLMAVA
ncbi:bifunctional proline dehydrogenase/L-glutamate gamma-semialdehyde dehydrogenase PutA [Novosphingobium sp. PASSN1]|uniref:bifunctional proline dehydrogenase/L-glutamate gamma-semialdehyde dehydrogenase PutA n=1 Tax=Novosphingobium sp. PASSN1 TaxID=2015561 RepID=UPI000BD35B8F|nr:bifunctional proline dehydrogenase/L-glutamate gamma-semialdehyde dehydrogenase PutA [Novosphingobium sp. PASSN1]OYU34557.1 MAG: trifunctional transcriptional regulator/proline dehydrogenase/L-glutamate gamma-semialdehyde dehydrogenase [Novosphingobium sp. PASSN1]